MSKIIRAVLPLQYTFTGNDRDASATQASDATLTFNDVSSSGMPEYKFNPAVPGREYTKVCAARILASGADNAATPEGGVAAKIKLKVGPSGNENVVEIVLSKYNEWQPKNISIKNSGTAPSSAKIAQGSAVYLDDFNIQDAYVGETTTAILELKIE